MTHPYSTTLQARFGRQVLVHWEDLAVSNAFNVLQVSAGVDTIHAAAVGLR
jgi:hypothetical protein